MLIGNVYLWCSLVANLWAIVTLIIGLKLNSRKLIKAGRVGILVVFAFCTLSVSVLLVALLTNDFSFRYVAEVSCQSQPLIYRIAGLWGGMSGSLLFYVWVSTIFSAILVLTNGRFDRAQKKLKN